MSTTQLLKAFQKRGLVLLYIWTLGLEPARPKSDQYALAVMVYEWFSGERPFRGTSDMIAIQHREGYDPEPLVGKIPGLSPEVQEKIQEVVFKALEKK